MMRLSKGARSKSFGFEHGSGGLMVWVGLHSEALKLRVFTIPIP